jgi:hypothetical protein
MNNMWKKMFLKYFIFCINSLRYLTKQNMIKQWSQELITIIKGITKQNMIKQWSQELITIIKGITFLELEDIINNCSICLRITITLIKKITRWLLLITSKVKKVIINCLSIGIPSCTSAGCVLQLCKVS